MVPSAVTPNTRFWLAGGSSAESSLSGMWCKDIRRLKGGGVYSSERYPDWFYLEEFITYPKKEPTSTPLVFSSSGTDSVPFVSGMSAEIFLAEKKA